MNRNEFIEKVNATLEHCKSVLAEKNKQYNKFNEPFLTFKISESVGICTAEENILTRIVEKICRINNQIKHGDFGGKLSDNLTDLINYCIILKIYLENKYETVE